MKPPASLVDSNGRPIQIGSEIASGGEGAVFSLLHTTDDVAKLYHQPPSVQKIDKLRAMIQRANPDLLKIAAWPKYLIHHPRTKEPVGFVMPRLRDCKPVQELYNPTRRMMSFPSVGWNFQVRVAMNLAAAFEEVHKCDCIVGDVNQSNAQVAPQATVRLVDCDSFQVRAPNKTYLCEVGVVHYTPPELQGKSFKGIVRTENHDRFGLAVLIYQLLFVGRHPYSGIYTGPGELNQEQLISQFRFSQGPNAKLWDMTPPKFTPTFSEIPPDLRELFQRAFERGSEKGTRPRPAEWLSVLRRLESNIAQCKADSGHKYWNGAPICVWCRLSENDGPEYYFGAESTNDTFQVDEGRIQQVLARLRQAQIDYEYDRRRYLSNTTSTPPEPVEDSVDDYDETTRILAIVTACCTLVIPLGIFVHRIFLGLSILLLIVMSAAMAIHLSFTPKYRRQRKRRAAFIVAERHLQSLEKRLKQEIARSIGMQQPIIRDVHETISKCRQLNLEYQHELNRLASDAKVRALSRYLRLQQISDAEINGIGDGRKQILMANSIFTADDINEDRVRSIPGFGDVLTKSLIDWKSQVIAQFRFNPTSAISSSDRRNITGKLISKQAALFSDIDRKLNQLTGISSDCYAVVHDLIPLVKEAIESYERADAWRYYA